MLRRTVGGAGGFEERRKGERFKLALPMQLNDGTTTGKQLELVNRLNRVPRTNREGGLCQAKS